MSLLNRVLTASDSPTQQRFPQTFIVALVGFLVVSPFVLRALDLFTFRRYVVLSFVWLLIISEVFEPSQPESVWWKGLVFVKIAGWLVVGYIVVERFTTIV